MIMVLTKLRGVALKATSPLQTLMGAGVVLAALMLSAPAAQADDVFEIQSCLETARSIGEPGLEHSCSDVVIRNCSGSYSRCVTRSHKAWEVMINDTYGAIRDQVRRDVFLKLRDAQRTWITFRDQDCAAAAFLYDGGSFEPDRRLQCLSDRTATRTIELLEFLEEVSR